MRRGRVGGGVNGAEGGGARRGGEGGASQPAYKREWVLAERRLVSVHNLGEGEREVASVNVERHVAAEPPEARKVVFDKRA